jgi:tetratricopeptide (TPR) repeat protein
MTLDATTRERLDAAIALREGGRDEEARDILVDLHDQSPLDPRINYHCAWVHDRLGLERLAVPFYETAIEQGLDGEDLRGAMLGLGSTYRALGEYEKARSILTSAVDRFPEDSGLEVFLAMALYNDGDGKAACEILLNLLADTSSAPSVNRYSRAIRTYAEDLDRTWQ